MSGNKPQLTLSLSGTKRIYAVLQARWTGEPGFLLGALHIQGKGPKCNRPYGVAVDIPLSVMPGSLRAWIQEWASNPVRFWRRSLSEGSEQRYARIQARLGGAASMTIRFQVPGEGDSFNRKYGACFRVPAKELPPLRDFLGYARAAGLTFISYCSCDACKAVKASMGTNQYDCGEDE